MQLISLSALSAFAIASAGLIQARPATHNAEIANRAVHRAIARDVAAPAPVKQARSPIVVPVTLPKKRSSSSKQKRCRIRPTSSSTAATSTASTATSTQVGSPDDTGTIDGIDNHHHGSSSSQAATPSATGSYNSNWKLAASRQGSSFFDAWTFWTDADPTHGNVQFVDQSSGLASVVDNVAYMKSSTADYPANGNRQSIRITDEQYVFNVGTLVIMDAVHMPTGCGTWPAFWMNGPNWPNGGEIDIVEGVHTDTQNHGTLHTADGCYATTDNVPAPSGQMSSASCGSSNGDNTGCGFTDTTSDNSYGAPFNQNNGGVYAMRLDNNGISMWFFPRGAIPDDITAEQPVPENWQAPFGSWSSSSCNTQQYFYQQTTIFDTTFCGDWAGATWQSSGCQDQTGAATCQDFVAGLGNNFSEAYWAVNYVKYFSSN